MGHRLQEDTMSGKDSWRSISAGDLYQAPANKGLDTASRLENNDVGKLDIAPAVHSKKTGCCSYLCTMRLELLAFIFTSSYYMTRISSTTMIMDKVCLVHLGYDRSVCGHLDNFTSIKTAVERLATNYQLAHSLIQIGPAAVLSCLLGPWSDHYGRKFPMGLAIVGMIVDAIGSTLCAHFLETRVEYYFIPAIFTGLFGGPVSALAVFYSYTADCTPEMVQRTMKYAFIDMAAGFAIPFGLTSGGWIFNFLGYAAVFFFSIGGLCLSLLILVFLLEETRGQDNEDAWNVRLRSLFSCGSLVESFRAVVKERPHKGRKQIVLLILSMCFIVITLKSTGDINYLFAHHQFGWSNTAYSTIMSIYAVIAMIALVIILPLMKRYRIQDPYLGLFGSATLFGKNLALSFAWTEGVFHTAYLIGLLGGCAAFAARARISKLVSNEDSGKVFSFVAAAESLLPIVASVLMSQLFAAFLEPFPGMPYLTLALFLILPLGVFSWMTCLPKMSYQDMSHTQKAEAA